MRKPIPGYEGIYEADQDGSVWRVGAPRNRPLKPVLVYGYHRVVLSKNDIKQPFLVHQLILLTFVGPCPAGQQCRHLNGVRTDNWLANLAYGTRAENQADRTRHGKDPVGERHPMAKLTEVQVLEIRAAKESSTKLAVRYGVSGPTIEAIRGRRILKHL